MTAALIALALLAALAGWLGAWTVQDFRQTQRLRRLAHHGIIQPMGYRTQAYEGHADDVVSDEDAKDHLEHLTWVTKDGTVLTSTQLEHVQPEDVPEVQPDEDPEAT